jgi:protease-4
MSFWKTVWAAMVGNIIASLIGSIISFVVVLFIIGALFGSEAAEGRRPDASVLRLNIGKPIIERGQEIGQLNLGGADQNIGLNDVQAMLNKAKTDESVQIVLLEVENIQAAPATLLAIHDAIVEFKNTCSKPVIAYAENYTQASYFVASAATEVYMYPEGMFDWRGINAEIMFYKRLLDNLEIEAQVIRGPNNKFKSAVEPYIYDKMSDANRQQLETFISDIWSTMCQRIGVQRPVSMETLDMAATELRYFNSSKAVEDGLLNGLIYKDELELKLKERLQANWNEGNSLADESISFQDYKAELITDQLLNAGNQQVAVVYAVGAIESGKGNDQTIGSERISKAIREARENPNVKAVVLRVNSPGGSALASDVIWRETQLLKQSGKPFVVSMGDYAASGGYYIACGADRIFALPNTITGSIGVFGVIPNLQKFFENKLGITFDRYETHAHADMLGFSKPFDTLEMTAMQNMVSDTYLDFITKVGQGRNMTPAQVDSIGQGRVWSGQDALAIGLVDELGGLNQAISYAASKAGIGDSYGRVDYPKMIDPLEEILEEISGENTAAKMMESVFGEHAKTFTEIQSFLRGGRIQTRLPFQLEFK